MDKLVVIAACDDGSCCCVPPRTTIALISVLSMVVCLIDLASYDSSHPCCAMKEYVESTRLVLSWFSVMANILLFMSSIMEIALLVNIYVWYSLGFILMGLCVAILDLLYRIKHEGVKGLLSFASEVIFLFVISLCLPIVNSYRKHLESYPLVIAVNPLWTHVEDIMTSEIQYRALGPNS